ncbi:hypothetical protein [Actinoplanes teichomyceticus]|uniref:hypothetical protein n=1 Tax=Actinoplanes teichomyceticus TaxID=1867 RepID=UPI0013DE58AA|nr:hypothetical protein [Actinoplanes teichomyceticus]GIF14131.1 hypothetical protein Ate01nite_41630 [Actinoplanes teichomyceticus]
MTGSGTGVGGSRSRSRTFGAGGVDVVDGQAQDAAERSGVEKQQDRGDAGAELAGVAGDQLAEWSDAPVLGYLTPNKVSTAVW